MKNPALRMLAFASLALAGLPLRAATMTAATAAPAVDGEDVANLGAASGTDKWFTGTSADGAAKGQSFTTGGAAVRLKAITYRITGNQQAAPTKTYAIRVGEVAGTNFTEVHSETATQNFTWNAGEYMTWTFDTPVMLEPYTTYGVDVGMLSSTSAWQTGIPYIEVTDDDYPGGGRYYSGASGTGTTTVTYNIGSDRVFHLDIESPLGPVFEIAATSPLDDAADALANRNVVLTFSQNVTPGTGNLTLRNLTDSIDTPLPANDPRLTYDQNVVRIDPAGLLAWSKDYAIRIDAGTFLGDGGAPIAAITDDATWNFTTLPGDPLLDAIAALKTHITANNLSGSQIAALKATIDDQRQRFSESAAIISAVFDLISTYETSKGPLFVAGSTVTGFNRNTTTLTDKKAVIPENFHWAIYTVMQYAMDVIYTADTLAAHEGLLAGYKFGSHADFPGPCAPPANPANTHTVSINGSFPVTFGRNTQQWTAPARKPTGTYLAPGTIATVTVPPELVNAGYKVRVGAHSWDLAYRAPVERLERITRLYPIDATTIKVANPNGGGIYLEVPIGSDAGVVSVTVTGGVRAPYFSAKTFHQTTSTEWNVEKTHTAPWADFQSEKFMMQVPRKWIYNMTSTQAAQLMTDWDAAMDAINSLMGFPLIRGKETMYLQPDVILRSSVHAPGYPAVNVTTNPNSEVSPAGYSGSYLVRGPNVSLTASNIEFHEQGHAYGFPKFGGESESNVNLLQPAMLNRAFGRTLDEAQNGSFGNGRAFITIDNTAVAWMTVFNFSPRNVPMADGEKAYQHKGHAKFMDIARLFGWEKLDAYWRSFMEDDANNIPYGTSDDDKLLRLSRHVGYDIRPLFHFWGIHPQNPSALASAIAAENIPPSTAIRDLLLHYKTLVPADNAAFRTFAQAWRGKVPSINGNWEEREHSRQWDQAALFGAGDQQRAEITINEEYIPACAQQIRDRVQELVDLYFPSGITPSQMSFAIAPSAVEFGSTAGEGTIGMTATTATAFNGPIQYFFENTTNGTDSGWITATTWQQGGLAAGDYSYRVKARDGLGEETAWSEPVVASLTASGDVIPPSPSPMTFSTPPYALDENTITMTATTATDVNGVEYEFENTSGGGGNSGWQPGPVFTDGNLTPSTEYGYRVRTRDSQGNITAWSAISSTNTADIPDVTAPQVVSLSPAGAITDVAANLVATFDEPVLVGGGNITLKNLTDGTQTQIAINDAARVSISGAVVTIDPPSDLAINKSYAVRIAAGAVVDGSNNPFIGINDDITWTFNVILQDPVANPGGPYNVLPAGQLVLNGGASLPSEGQTITTYEWDLNNDNTFGDATGATPGPITYADLTTTWGMTPGANTIQLRVTDSAAKASTVQTTVYLLQLYTFDGANKSNGDNWNVATNWNPDAVPAGFAEVLIPANKYVTADNTNPQPYSGNLTLGAGATLQCGYSGANGWTYMNALGTAGSTTITMGAGSGIILRGNYAPAMPAMVLQGDVSLTIGTSTSGGPDPTFSRGISGPHTVYLEGKGDSFMTIDTTPNTFSSLVVRQVTASGLNINANVAGALGTGDVTIRANQSGVITGNLTLAATDAIASTATLALYGPASATKLKLTANNTVRRLLIDGVTQPAGTYGKVGSGAQYEVSWIDSTSTATLTVAAAPSLHWDLNDSTAGAGSIAGDASGTWDAAGNLWNNADGDGIALPWTPGQQAVFSAGTDATGTSTVTVSGTHDIGGLAFEEGDITLSGGGLRMTSDSELNVGSGRTAEIASSIGDDSARKLTKSGAGTLALSGTNTYTGPTWIDQGVLSVAGLADAGTGSPIGSYPAAGAGGLILSGGTFRYTGNSATVNRGLTLMGDSTFDVATAGATLTLGDCETANQSGTLTVTGAAGSVLALGRARIVEAAQLTLNPTSATMIVGSANGYTSYSQTSILTLAGTSTGNVVTGVISQTNPPGSAFSQSIQVVKSGSGDWRLNGTSTYTGVTTVQAGTLITGTNAPHNANGAFGKSTTEVNLGVVNGNDDAAILTGGAHTIGRPIRLPTANTTDSGTRVLTLGGGTAHASTISGSVYLGTNNQAGRGVNLTAAAGGTVTFSGVIQNPTGMDATTYTVTKTGAGTVVFANSPTYTGDTLVSEGTLQLNAATLGTSSITVASGAKLGFTLGTPVTAAAAAVNLADGTVKITGTVDNASSYKLLTAASITGTPTLDPTTANYTLQKQAGDTELWLVYGVSSTPYQTWATGGGLFGGDANGDGVANGLAFLLGAADPDADALGLLPAPTGPGNGDLVLSFSMRNAANRGTSVLKVQWSADLGVGDLWSANEAMVPDADGTVNGVVFEITAGDPLNTVTATIPSGEAGGGGKLFGRLEGTE